MSYAYTPHYASAESKALQPTEIPISPQTTLDDEKPDYHRSPDAVSHVGCFAFRGRRKNSAPRQPVLQTTASAHLPGIDAPTSATNAGERRVQIQCDKIALYFPVHLTTTPSDLLYSAANCFSTPFDPKTVVLVEHYAKLSIQRPLRRYEHVRNVLNSWDSDDTNQLVIKTAKDTGADPVLLLASTVTHQRPMECSFQMHHSQRPGKWSQCLITIRSDGQVTSARKPRDKHHTNICHLSDSDMYMPTPEARHQKLKPPKEHCLAIKSQQKTTMFEEKQNFVHFFCTSDKPLIVQFYVAAQAWRSWYLVNELGEGKKPTKQADPSTSPRQQYTLEESPYRIGSMKPLIDMARSDTIAPQLSSSTDFSPTRNKSVRRDKSVKDRPHAHQVQLSENEPLANIFINPGNPTQTASPVRSPSQRQPIARHSDDVRAPADTSTIPTPSGSSEAPARHTSPPIDSTEFSRRSNDLARLSSRPEPKPLVNLTPSYCPPPQHQRKGRGFVPDEGGPLIEAATTPVDPINAPPATDWRGRNAVQQTRQLHSAKVGASNSSAARERSKRNTGRRFSASDDASQSPHRRTMSPKIPQQDQDAFVPGGLIDQIAPAQGGHVTGRGVMQGSNAKGPMLDLREPSAYAPGSLLARQEAT